MEVTQRTPWIGKEVDQFKLIKSNTTSIQPQFDSLSEKKSGHIVMSDTTFYMILIGFKEVAGQVLISGMA